MFFVGRTLNYDGPPGIVDFDVTITDRRGDFDLVSDTFVAPSSGIYFFALSCGVREAAETNYRLSDVGGNSVCNARRSSTAHGAQDIISRDVIVPLNQGDVRYMNLTSPDGLYSDNQMQTSLAGFSLHDALSPVSAFSVAINQSTSQLGVVGFNKILTNNNNDYDQSLNAYVAPADGIYLFSVSAGLNARVRARVIVLVNGFATYELWRDHIGHDAVDIISRYSNMNT